VWNTESVRRVPYQLPEVLAAKAQGECIYICEGEKDALTLVGLGVVATCNSGGAGKWSDELNTHFDGADVVIVPHHDYPGWNHVNVVRAALAGIAARIRVLRLPNPSEKKGYDATNWFEAGGTVEQLRELTESAPAWAPPASIADRARISPALDEGVSLDDFYAYMESHSYIFVPTRAMWPAASVNARIPEQPLLDADGEPVFDGKGNPVMIKASAWLDQNKPVEQMTWAPGLEMVISGRLITEGGWIGRDGTTTFNLYRPPTVRLGDPTGAARWLDHIRRVFPEEVDHIVLWLAHRVQRPQEKINHALVFGGEPGIGKDSILEPVKVAVGPWNFQEVSPRQVTGRFNGFLKSVILRVSEGRDLGETDRFSFYEHMKVYTAAPPDVLRVDEKHLREHNMPNCCGVIITTNHKDGVYLPDNDRRHFVAWSGLTQEDFEQDYWDKLHDWYRDGGTANVAAYLANLDISGFNPKAPPPKTPAFYAMVETGRTPEDAEMADVLDDMGNPEAVTLPRIISRASDEFAAWLLDRKNRRTVCHRLEKCGYLPVRNTDTKDGLWRINGKRQAIYGRSTLSNKERFLVLLSQKVAVSAPVESV
jgi:hypothetical protein